MQALVLEITTHVTDASSRKGRVLERGRGDERMLED
jgi:hypothetical protein